MKKTKVESELSLKLQRQCFEEDGVWHEVLKKCQTAAGLYASIENNIAVLSDLKNRVSYIYYGGLSKVLGIDRREASQIISSIWEKELLGCIHPDDLSKKHLEELRFFHFLHGIPKQQRSDYYLRSGIRMLTASGDYIPVLHRIFYLSHQQNGSVCLALCLYGISAQPSLNCHIVNTVTGECFEIERPDCANLISAREKVVLELIGQGKLSKEIADILSISVHTVNRHRQNILEKLKVSNSVEAYQIARQLNII